MDIGENVTAILCVVVGILIIGTALVPIVDHASQTEGDIITGTNQATADGYYFLMITDQTTYNIDINSTNDAYSINGVAIGAITVVEKVSDEIIINLANNGSHTITGYTVTGSEACVLSPDLFPCIYIGGVADTDDTSVALTIPNATVGVVAESLTVGSDDWVEIGGATFNDGIIYYDGQPVPATDYDWITITENANGTWTLVSTDYYLYGPQTWTGHTAGGTSQYAALYGIIPIMCILGMGYVLIRRF